jgi:hypothetical protein
MAPWKQAAYPAAKSCSGLVVPGASDPPSALGNESFTLRFPSLETASPARPPGRDVEWHSEVLVKGGFLK